MGSAFSFRRGRAWAGGFPKPRQNWGLPGTAAGQHGATGPKDADSPASFGGRIRCLTSTRGYLASLPGPTHLRENREPFLPCHCLRSGFIRIEAVQAAAREIPSILKMTRLNLLDQDSCVVQGDENYTNSSASSVNRRSLPAQGHVA